MKRLPLLTLLAGIILTSGGCDLGTVDPDREGTLVATLDGEAWQGTAQTWEEADTFVIRSFRRNVANTHWLTIRVVETSPGVYAVVTAAMSARPTRYEENGGTYAEGATAGTISFTELNRSTGRAVGTVRLTLQGGRGITQLEDGEFDAWLYNDAYRPR